MDRWEIENLRRSLAMVAAGSTAPLTTSQAEDLLRSLTQTEAELERIREGLRRLLDGPRTPPDGTSSG